MVNSFCQEFSLQSHAALHGEFLSLTHPVLGYAGSTSCMAMAMLVYMGSVSYKLHAQCWFIYMGSFSYMPSAGLYGSFSYMPSAV